MQDKPFVFLGVNSDSKERLRNAVRANGLNWRSWWDGGSPGGPIAQLYQVRGWPTLFVLDHRGMIRYRDLHGQELLEAVQTLVAAAQTAEGEAP